MSISLHLLFFVLYLLITHYFETHLWCYALLVHMKKTISHGSCKTKTGLWLTWTHLEWFLYDLMLRRQFFWPFSMKSLVFLGLQHLLLRLKFNLIVFVLHFHIPDLFQVQLSLIPFINSPKVAFLILFIKVM